MTSGGVSVVMFSGGITSWATGRRVSQRHGRENLTLLFADTLIEDEDLYRFLAEAAANVGGELVKIADGRTPWQVFSDVRLLGNTRMDPCSKILKRQLMRRWLEGNCDPASTTVYLGFDWTELHRLERAQRYWSPWRVEAPLTEAPYLTRREFLAALEAEGIEPPRLYTLGFQHNNCGGFCIKAGQAQFAHLLRTLPERYRWHEEKEEALRAELGKDVAILRDRRWTGEGRGGEDTKPLTLRAFRERIELQPSLYDELDWGGCGCLEPPRAEAPDGE